MIEVKYTGDALWQRIERAVENVKNRLRRVSTALNLAAVPYAIIGGNAVQHWVSQVDESVVRNTRDVDILINRADLPVVIQSLTAAGFIFRESSGVTMFLDGPDAKARDAVHVVFTGERVRPDHPEAAPTIDTFVMADEARTISLHSLVRMKLNAFRDKDRVHLRDMISVGLVDPSWLPNLSAEHQTRLQQLLDDPEG